MAVRKEGEKTKTGRQIEGEKNKKKGSWKNAAVSLPPGPGP